MLRRSTKIQLLLFVIITLVGVSYVSAQYVGLTKGLFGNNGCTISAEFPDSGGIFTNAEVTYNGVTVGKVGEISLRDQGGVIVKLNVDDCTSPKIPTDTYATVADRSVVGEQYVNLAPQTSNGPYITGDATLPMMRNGKLVNNIPTATTTLLTNLDALAKSVPLDSLRTTVSELYNAVSNRGQDLGNLLDASNTLLNDALLPQNLDNTIALIQNSSTVLQTQLDIGDPLRSWTKSLRLISEQLKASDPDIRRLLNNGPGDLNTISSFISNNKTDFGAVLANLDTLGQITVRHLNGIEQVLELYPALAAGGNSVLHDRRGALGLVLQSTPDPQDCGDPNVAREGYSGVRRQPEALAPIAPNVAARCTAPLSTGKQVRGSANVPGGDPISVSGGGVAYPRVLTQNTTDPTIGTSLNKPTNLADASWMSLLTNGLH